MSCDPFVKCSITATHEEKFRAKWRQIKEFFWKFDLLCWAYAIMLRSNVDRFPQTNNQNRDERTNKQREQISQKHIYSRTRMMSHRESDLDETEFRVHNGAVRKSAQVCCSSMFFWSLSLQKKLFQDNRDAQRKICLKRNSFCTSLYSRSHLTKLPYLGHRW